MKNLKYILISAFFLHIFGSTAQNASDEIVFKALNDEMARSLSSLKLDKYNPPFLIASSLCDGQYYSARASMGALIRSKEVPLRNESFRLMVGSYEINDENFSGGSASYRSG